MKKAVNILVGLPVALVLLTLAIANRHPVRLVLDPFHPENPTFSLTLPFYVYLLGGLMAGVALGGIVTWLTQGRWRHAANLRTREARRWQSEAERLARERDEAVMRDKSAAPGSAKGPAAHGRQLALAGRR